MKNLALIFIILCMLIWLPFDALYYAIANKHTAPSNFLVRSMIKVSIKK